MNVALESILKCPLCESSNHKLLFYAHDVQFSKTMMKFPLVRCQNCKLIYLKERPSQECISAFYPKDMYPTYKKIITISDSNSVQNKLKKAVKERLKERKSRRVDYWILRHAPPHWQVASLFPPKSRILDIGCGAGWKLDLFKEFGWETYGFDISAEATEIARKKGHNVQTGQFEDINYPDNFFTAVQISHVIEHLPDPKIVFERVYNLLMNDGILLVETPNISGIIAKVFRADYWQVDSPRHFQLFTKKTISSLINMAGFMIDKVVTYNSKNGILNSIQSFVTRRYGKGINIKGNPLLKLINTSLYYLLNLSCKLGSGENIAVFAKKKK